MNESFKLKVLSKEELTDLLMKFVRMSDKKSQQKTINEIRQILIKLGPTDLSKRYWEGEYNIYKRLLRDSTTFPFRLE